MADLTSVGTGAGCLYLAVVVDAFSRRVVGWAMATHLRPELVLETLNMAIWRRRPQRVIHHSDQGSQYTSLECELLDRSSFRTPEQARRAVFEFVEGWYNPHRRHSSLEYHSPVS